MRFYSYLLSTAFVGCIYAADNVIEYPRLSDNRLQISLYASDPDIVTPIGAAVDAKGHLFVVECHTHSPPKNYPGPKGDLIKVFEGTRADGRYERRRVFADDLFQAQSVAFDRQGTLYVVCTRGVFALHDRDGDGRSEARTRILHLDPYEKRANPHGQMMGIAFSNDDWVYIGRGAHVGGEYAWVGSDGKRLTGGYDGGDIVRCRPDGTGLERVATGFWNPFSLTFDRQNRLLAIDNDPDARGPNRLLHIVMGGDYGYKTLFGRYGLHPYQGWEGELPGTLPMIHGIGESPTGVIDANAAALPAEYRDTIIGAAWGEHNLALYRPQPAGASIRASLEIFLQGLGHDNATSPFRPSGLTTSPVDGSIFISDWMLIDYTTHGRGRIWKVTAKPGVATVAPRAPFAPCEPTPEFVRLQRLTEASQLNEHAILQKALTEDDPFIRSAAVAALSRPVFRPAVIRDLKHGNAKIRLGALLALRKADVPDPAPLVAPLLADSNVTVVQTALIWTGEKVLKSLAKEVDAVAARPNLTKELFQTWLATVQILQHPGLEELYAKKTSPGAISRQLSPAFIEQLVHNEQRPVMLRALAMRWLPNIEKSANHDLLVRLTQKGDPAIRLEAIRRLADSSRAEAATTLRAIATDRSQPAQIRSEALVSLAGKPHPSLVALLDDPERSVRLEAARTLRGATLNPAVMAAVRKKLAAIQKDPKERKLASQLEFLIDSEKVARPSSLDGWKKLLATGGDAEAGRRVFFSANATCNACHSVEGRGIKLGSGATAGFIAMPLGPELSVVARTASREALIHSIVRPSDYIAPEYQGWFVKMKNGEIYTGREIDQGDRAIQLIMLDGHEHDFPRENIESWGALEQSLMPAGLPLAMAVEEFRDLVAYLESLK